MQSDTSKDTIPPDVTNRKICCNTNSNLTGLSDIESVIMYAHIYVTQCRKNSKHMDGYGMGPYWAV